jgi:hypothetical protein
MPFVRRVFYGIASAGPIIMGTASLGGATKKILNFRFFSELPARLSDSARRYARA